ncbi:MAG: LysR family transcriptional regulator [Peptococcaceae bacterium]|nr:LysR family transcriptional regulator [Peptococcaceae bacterium]
MLNDSIRVFLTVVEKKSFSKAAKALFLTQPAVSFQIQMLEEYYGTRLFDRVSRNIVLTEAGHMLLKYANEMSNLQQELEKEMQDLTANIKGKLKIGASTTIGEYIAPYILGAFKQMYPEVQLSLEVANSEDIEAAVHDTTLDIGLIESSLIGKDLEAIPFLQDKMMLITPPDHPWAKTDSISVFELDKYPFISREKGSGTRVEMEQHLKKAGFSANNLNVIMELGSSSAIKAAVESNLGISILSKWTVQAEAKAGLLHQVNFKEDEFNRTFHIIYHKKKFRTQATEEFLRFLKSDGIEDLIKY